MAKVELDIRAQIANLQKGLNKTETQLKGLQQQSNKTSKTMQSNMKKTSGVVTNLTAKIGALLTIGAAIQFTRAIIRVRSEFEKFNAVLTTSLGSARAANREFEKIQRFAADTPFSVQGLTDSFVRLVNQGFKPTIQQMRLLGDLSASTGKDFVQLTEAIIDAQVGEFERLKEFGIRASKQGDQVTFTFKEIQTQVEFTASAIQEYILSLGEMEGVTGSMAAISETLGGRISNLGDAWDILLNTLGEKSGGVFKFTIGLLTGALNVLADYNELQEGVTQNSKDFVAAFAEGNEELGTTEEKIAAAREEMEHYNELYMQMNDNVNLYADVFSKKERKSFEALATTYNAITIALSEYIAEQKELLGDDGNIAEIESIETIQKQMKGLIDEKKKLSIVDTERLGEINRLIKGYKDQIDVLNKLGVALETKDLKTKDITIDEDEIFKTQEELDKQDLERQKAHDAAILASAEARVDKELQIMLAAEQEKRLLSTGTVDAINAGFDLLKAVNKDNAKAQQAINIAQAIMNGALGITKTGAELGYPAAIPFQIALALQTLAQIATIRAQKFERGGYEVLAGRRHAQGGVDIGIGEAEQGEGVAVFSRQATQKYGKFLPAFVKAMNENDATVTGYADNAYNISLDDSRQVNKLEAIRELLAQPEVSHVNGYKIITRHGHITKVKI